MGADEGPAHVHRGAVDALLGPHPAPHAVPGLEHHDRATGLLQAPRGSQACVAGPDDRDVDLLPSPDHGRQPCTRVRAAWRTRGP